MKTTVGHARDLYCVVVKIRWLVQTRVRIGSCRRCICCSISSCMCLCLEWNQKWSSWTNGTPNEIPHLVSWHYVMDQQACEMWCFVWFPRWSSYFTFGFTHSTNSTGIIHTLTPSHTLTHPHHPHTPSPPHTPPHTHTQAGSFMSRFRLFPWRSWPTMSSWDAWLVRESL